MTTRYNALVVVLEQDIRDDDAEYTINAIKQIKNVLDVKPNEGSMQDLIAYSRMKHRVYQKILSMFDEERVS